MSGLDFEQDSDDKAARLPTPDELDRLSKLANAVWDGHSEVAALELQLKKAKQQLDKLESQDLPDLMDEIGVSQFTTSDGASVDVKELIVASIPAKNRPEAFAWLKTNDCDSIVKNTVTIKFGKGEDDVADEIYNELAEMYDSVGRKKDIHYQTLQAFVREREEQGQPVPEDLFGVFHKRKAIVKLKA